MTIIHFENQIQWGRYAQGKDLKWGDCKNSSPMLDALLTFLTFIPRTGLFWSLVLSLHICVHKIYWWTNISSPTPSMSQTNTNQPNHANLQFYYHYVTINITYCTIVVINEIARFYLTQMSWPAAFCVRKPTFSCNECLLVVYRQ
jgi:hypothetical protein